MASAAAPTANLLQTCAALLMSPYCGMHSPNIEAVLVKIGLQSTHIGLKLIEILLRNCAAAGTDPASESERQHTCPPLGRHYACFHLNSDRCILAAFVNP